MYAVVSTGGKQLKVEKGTEAVVEKLDAAVGDTVVLDVLFVADGDSIVTGADAESASVTVQVVEHFKGEKLIVFKFKKRKGYKRTKGHRQNLTKILVTDIATSGGAKKAAPKKAEKPKAAAPKAEKPKAEKPKAEKPKAEKPKAEAPKKAEKPKAAKAVAEVSADCCAATKADGTPCANKPKEGSKYCGVHAKKIEG